MRNNALQVIARAADGGMRDALVYWIKQSHLVRNSNDR